MRQVICDSNTECHMTLLKVKVKVMRLLKWKSFTSPIYSASRQMITDSSTGAHYLNLIDLDF